jgi:hypothetical protein
MSGWHFTRRLWLAACITAGLALSACGESPAERGADDSVTFAGTTNACKDLSDEDCVNKAACVLEHYCEGSGVCSSTIDGDTSCNPEPVCTTECKHWKNAACMFLDKKKRCDQRDDCEWMCVQLAIGCPPEDPDCGVHCGCNSTVVESEPPITGPPGVEGGSPPLPPEQAQAKEI